MGTFWLILVLSSRLLGFLGSFTFHNLIFLLGRLLRIGTFWRIIGFFLGTLLGIGTGTIWLNLLLITVLLDTFWLIVVLSSRFGIFWVNDVHLLVFLLGSLLGSFWLILLLLDTLRL